MERKIIISKKDSAVWTFLAENGEIVEIHCCPNKSENKTEVQVGNIYIGKVSNISANIGAAFIDIGGVNCYYDLSQAGTACFTHKYGKKPICIGDEILVQISREAVKTKAPTVSSNLNFSGRYAVLTSGNTRIGASSKIPKQQREEWKEALSTFKNEDYGLIVRTNAKDVPFEEVLSEIEDLISQFKTLRDNAMHRTCYSCMSMAPKQYLNDLKNVYMEGLSEIIIEDPEIYEEVQEYFKKEQPDLSEKLRLYKDSMLPLDKLYQLDSVMQKALNKNVWLKHGGYLVIEPTEALTVVDVNSGKDSSKKKKEDSTLRINLEAAKEIAKQIRLRNYSGIILVDFINMDSEQQLQTLMKELRYYLSSDPIQTTLVDITALHLVEITRKKVRKPLHEYAYQCRKTSYPEAKNE